MGQQNTVEVPDRLCNVNSEAAVTVLSCVKNQKCSRTDMAVDVYTYVLSLVLCDEDLSLRMT